MYEAQSFYHSTTQGYAAQSLAKAVSLIDRATDRERLYIEAAEARENAFKSPSPGSPATQELEIWRKIAKQYPEDTQARIFLAERVERPVTPSRTMKKYFVLVFRFCSKRQGNGGYITQVSVALKKALAGAA